MDRLSCPVLNRGRVFRMLIVWTQSPERVSNTSICVSLYTCKKDDSSVRVRFEQLHIPIKISISLSFNKSGLFYYYLDFTMSFDLPMLTASIAEKNCQDGIHNLEGDKLKTSLTRSLASQTATSVGIAGYIISRSRDFRPWASTKTPRVLKTKRNSPFGNSTAPKASTGLNAKKPRTYNEEKLLFSAQSTMWEIIKK